MTHEWWLSAAECGKCNGDIAQWTTREKESWVHMVRFEHLKAQKDALYAAMVPVWGSNQIEAIIEHSKVCDCQCVPLLANALRAQLEAKK